MTRTGPRQTDPSTDTGFRAHLVSVAVVAGIVAALLVAGLLGAPLVAVLLVGLLLVCPLLMWAPFRFEERSRDRAHESFRRAGHT